MDGLLISLLSTMTRGSAEVASLTDKFNIAKSMDRNEFSRRGRGMDDMDDYGGQGGGMSSRFMASALQGIMSGNFGAFGRF